MTQENTAHNPLSNMPRQGQMGFIDFDPSSGFEIQKRRPALVISQDAFNLTGFCIVCPITNTDISLFEKVPDGLKVTGYINPIQVKSIDWRARKWKYEDDCPSEQLEKIQQVVIASVVGACTIELKKD